MSGTMFERQVFEQFLHPGEVVEVRIPGASGKSPAWGNDLARGPVAGWFADHDAFCQAVRAADKARHTGIYFTLQVIDPRLLSRAANRLLPMKTTTSDNEVLAYRWLPIDVDPIRPTGISSSDEELAAAQVVRDDVASFLAEEHGFPTPIRACSGNGWHLLYRLPDLPKPEGQRLVRGMLEMLAARFDNDQVLIDRVNHNPSRIWKCYGTTARKGDPVPDRPHRTSFIETMEDADHARSRAHPAGDHRTATQHIPF